MHGPNSPEFLFFDFILKAPTNKFQPHAPKMILYAAEIYEH